MVNLATFGPMDSDGMTEASGSTPREMNLSAICVRKASLGTITSVRPRRLQGQHSFGLPGAGRQNDRRGLKALPDREMGRDGMQGTDLRRPKRLDVGIAIFLFEQEFVLPALQNLLWLAELRIEKVMTIPFKGCIR